LSIVYISIKLQCFGSWFFFHLQVKGKRPPGLRLAQPGGPTARVSVLFLLTEDGKRSSFRNVVILSKYRRWTKSKQTHIFIGYKASSSEPFRLHLKLKEYTEKEKITMLQETRATIKGTREARCSFKSATALSFETLTYSPFTVVGTQLCIPRPLEVTGKENRGTGGVAGKEVYCPKK
jgi:hypothetical protein